MENQQSLNVCKAMEQELMRGRDTANQLLEVILNTRHGDVEGLILPSAEDLVRKVLRSFTITLKLIKPNVSDEEVLPITTRDLSMSPANFPKLDDMDKAALQSFFNDDINRRGCSKRRSNELTWEKDSSILIDDGYVWKKYGQKKIMNVKYPRSYYRCTYKDAENCPAIKQVQRIQEEPPLYRTMYYGLHTCKSSLNSDMTLESNTSFGSSTFLSFNSNIPDKEQYSFSSSHFAPTKQEVILDYDILPTTN